MTTSSTFRSTRLRRRRRLGRASARRSPLACKLCGAPHPAAAVRDLRGMSRPARAGVRPRAGRSPTPPRSPPAPPSLWRYREWLPFDGEPVVSLDSGFTPLLDAPALARGSAWRASGSRTTPCRHPSLSFKDRVVATALNAALGPRPRHGRLRLDRQPGQRGRRPGRARRASRPGSSSRTISSSARWSGTAVYGPHLVRVRGTYDDVNRLCAQAADRFGWGLVNINLRGYYGEGSKTMAFEIAEQLGWRLPTAVVAPMAGGSLLTKLEKGFREFARRRAGVRPGAAALRRAGRGLRADRATWSSAAASTLTPVHARTRSRARSRSAIRPTAASRRARSAGPAAGPRACPTPRSSTASGCWPRPRASSPRRRAASTVAGALGAGPRPAGSGPTTRSSSASPATDSRPSRRCRARCPRRPIIAPRIRELEALYGRDL